MSKKKIENAVKVLEEIKAEVNAGVIKDSKISKLRNMETARETGLAVVLNLSTKHDYPSTIIDKWRKRLDAEDYVISVIRKTLRITFNVMY